MKITIYDFMKLNNFCELIVLYKDDNKILEGDFDDLEDEYKNSILKNWFIGHNKNYEDSIYLYI